MTIRLLLNKKTVKIGDIVRAEEGFAKNREMVEWLAHFVASDDGKIIPLDEAISLIMELPMEDIPDLVAQVTEGVKALQAQAVPLAISDDS